MSKELEALINIGAIFVSCISNEDGDIDYCHLRNHNEYSNWYSTVEKALKRNEKIKSNLHYLQSFINECKQDYEKQPEKLIKGVIESNVSKYLYSLECLYNDLKEQFGDENNEQH